MFSTPNTRLLASWHNRHTGLLALSAILLSSIGCGGGDSPSDTSSRVVNKIVYVARYTPELGASDGQPLNSVNTRLYAINADGTRQERLLQTAEEVYDVSPSFSADGAKVAFLSSRDDCGVGCRKDRAGNLSPLQIWVTNTDGSQPRRLTNFPSNSTVNTVSLSRDGSQVLYTNFNGIFSRSVSTGETTTLAEGNLVQNATFSPDESAILFEEVNGRIAAYIMNRDGTGKTLLAAGAYNATFSPDGSRIIYCDNDYSADRVSGSNAIWTMNRDGSGKTRLTTDAAIYHNPAFSPDGTKIVALSASDGGPDRLVTIDANGNNKTQVPLPEIPSGPTAEQLLLSPYAWR